MESPDPQVLENPLEAAAAEDIDREPTKEEIMDDIRQGIPDAKAGHGVPAREAIEAMLKRMYGDANDR